MKIRYGVGEVTHEGRGTKRYRLVMEKVKEFETLDRDYLYRAKGLCECKEGHEDKVSAVTCPEAGFNARDDLTACEYLCLCKTGEITVERTRAELKLIRQGVTSG